jgi:hypothetical protein
MRLHGQLSTIRLQLVRSLLGCVLSLSMLDGCGDGSAPATPSPSPSRTASPTPSPSSSPTPTSTLGPAAHRISGHVAMSPFCELAAPDVSVELRPAVGSVVTAADGTFAFEGVADGEYELVFDSAAFIYSLTVAGRDENVGFCLDCPTSLQLDPRRGAAGATIQVSGGPCYALHSGRTPRLFFDDVLVAMFAGSQSGDYHGTFVVPLDAAPGPHTLRLPRAGDFPNAGGEIATAQFIVLPPP